MKEGNECDVLMFEKEHRSRGVCTEVVWGEWHKDIHSHTCISPGLAHIQPYCINSPTLPTSERDCWLLEPRIQARGINFMVTKLSSADETSGFCCCNYASPKQTGSSAQLR
jgi:hypothetical protein